MRQREDANRLLRMEIEHSKREREATERHLAEMRSILADIRYQAYQAEAAAERWADG
jgi:hypothetical protein